MKNVIVVACLVLVSFTTNAQSGAVGFTYGLFAGTTSTNFTTNINYEDKTSGAGFTAGGFGRFKLLIFTVQPEVAYSLKNVAFTAYNSGELYNVKLKSSNLDINALVNLLGFSLGDLARFRLQIGAGACMDLGSSVDINGSVSDAENTKGTYWNGIGGIGIDVLKLTADLRYSFAFGDIVEGNAVDITPSSVFFTIGYKFR